MTISEFLKNNYNTDLAKLNKSKYRFYHSFNIKKRSGEFREILAPSGLLKITQKYILQEYLSNHNSHGINHGFQKGKSVKTNAEVHKNAEIILNVDIKDFFNNCRLSLIHHSLLKNGIEKKYAYNITGILCYKNGVPQGAPSSPYLTNLAMKHTLDKILISLAIKHGCKVTRYCDDITFSHSDKNYRFKRLLSELNHRLSKAPLFFKLNRDKTRILRPHRRQEITGVVINQDLSTPRKYRKNLRAQIHNYLKNPSDSEYKKIIGKISWVNYINPTQAISLKKLIGLNGV